MSSATTTAGAMALKREPFNLRTVERLQMRKRNLEAMIDAEERRPRPNEDALRRLKREKLQVKEALVVAASQQH